MDCSSVSQESLCVEAEVEVDPKAEVVGKIRSFCIGSPTLEPCPDHMPSDTVVVSQLICVKVPLSFSAKASVQSTGITCDESCPDPNPCCSDLYDFVREVDKYRYKRSYNDKPARLFYKNYYATYQNNPKNS